MSDPYELQPRTKRREVDGGNGYASPAARRVPLNDPQTNTARSATDRHILPLL